MTKADFYYERPALSRHDRQRRVQADVEKFSRLAASPNLSPRAAAAAHHLARGARASLALLDERLIRSLFPPHYRREARSLVAHLRSHGESPERIEYMLRLAREIALGIDAYKPDHDLAPRPRLAQLAAAPDHVDHVPRIAQSLARSDGAPEVNGIILGLLRRSDGDPRDHVRHVAAALKRNGTHARIWRKLLWGDNEFDGGATRYGHQGAVGQSYESTRGTYTRELAIIRTLLARHHGIHGPEPHQ